MIVEVRRNRKGKLYGDVTLENRGSGPIVVKDRTGGTICLVEGDETKKESFLRGERVAVGALSTARLFHVQERRS